MEPLLITTLHQAAVDNFPFRLVAPAAKTATADLGSVAGPLFAIMNLARPPGLVHSKTARAGAAGGRVLSEGDLRAPDKAMEARMAGSPTHKPERPAPRSSTS